jgi:hypothetical protein
MAALKGPVHCQRCGHEWARDPVLEVACPVCRAKAGSPCVARAPSGHVKSGAFQGLPPWGHDERDLLAAREGHYKHDCAAGDVDPLLYAEQGDLGL